MKDTTQKELWIPPKDTQVLVGKSKLLRYSTGELDNYRNLLCYTDGCTSSTPNANTFRWHKWEPVQHFGF